MTANFRQNARSIISPLWSEDITASKVCLQCRLNSLISRSSTSNSYLRLKPTSYRAVLSKRLSTVSNTKDGPLDHKESAGESQKVIESRYANNETRPSTQRIVKENTSGHNRFSRLPKQFSIIINELTTRATLVGQRVNTLTGTDYSAIESLRRTIKEHEQSVTSRHKAIYKAREAVDAAHTQQAASQKEVVGLLERKSSWSAADLERYMALIRSEHSNELAVQAAKESLNEAERALEEARSQLEKKERAQYHEEQIWSDTIRRNSTWVTIGLMGVNMLILLSSVIIIEPWRRKNMVKEIRAVLDQQIAQQRLDLASGKAAIDGSDTDLIAENKAMETESDLRTGGEAVSATTLSVAEELAGSCEPPMEDSSTFATGIPLNGHKLHVKSSSSPIKDMMGTESSVTKAFTRFKNYFHEAFSDHHITIRQNELTKAALQGASVGAVLIAVMFGFIRSR